MEDLARLLILKIERAVHYFVLGLNLKLDDGMVFRCARMTSSSQVQQNDLTKDVFYLELYFMNLQNPDDGKKIPVAVGSWRANTLEYSLSEGPEELANFLFTYLGFGVGMVHERFEEIKGDYTESQPTLS